MNTILLGYGNQAVMLTASNSTSAATTYAWSPTIGLSNANIANPVFIASVAGTYIFKVIATNEFGCSAANEVTIKVENYRSGNKKDKILMSHGGNKISVTLSAIQAH